MTNLFKESFILSNIYRLILFIRESFKASFLYSAFSKLTNKFDYLLANSKFWSYYFSQDKIDAYYKNSLVNKYLSLFLNLPTRFLTFINKRFYRVLKHSLVYKLLVFLSEKFVYLFGIVLVFTMLVPDHRWYNIFGVASVFALLFIYLIKTATSKSFSLDLNHIDFSILVFMLAIFLSFVLSLFPKDSLNSFIYFTITFLGLLILVNSVEKRKDLNIIINFLVLGTFLTAIYGVYQWKIVGIEVNPSLTDITVNQGMSGRVFSTMGNPNIYGELLVLTMPFFLVSILNSDKFLARVIYGIGFLSSLVILLKTGSRSAWVAFAFSLGVFIFFKKKSLLPFFVLVGFILVPFLPDSIYRRVLTIFNPNDSSLQYRKEILEPAMPMLKDYWFTGVGLGSNTFNTIYKRYKSFTLKTVAHTHNLFLQIWLEAGIVALVAFLLMGFRLIKKTSFILRKSQDEKLINIAIGSISAIGGIVIMGFADHIWFYNRILFMFWIIVGILLSVYKLVEKELGAN